MAETETERLTKIEEQVKDLQESNKIILKRLDEMPQTRRRIVTPIPPSIPPVQEINPKEQEFEYEGHTYKFVPKKESWMRAKKSAEKAGFYLAVINSEKEQQAIETKLKEIFPTNETSIWIGLNDIDEEGKWVWVNGDEVSFTKWHKGEPNNYGGVPESCATIRMNYNDTNGWNDCPMDCEFYYLMEKSKSSK